MPVYPVIAVFGIGGTDLLIILGIALLFFSGSGPPGGGPRFPVLAKIPDRLRKIMRHRPKDDNKPRNL